MAYNAVTHLEALARKHGLPAPDLDTSPAEFIDAALAVMMAELGLIQAPKGPTMTNAKHSPAPWAFCIGGNIGNLICDANGRTVATYQASDRGRTYDEEEAQAQANGCLIVAAPMLLDAAEMALEYLDRTGTHQPGQESLRAAIALARGGAVVGATVPETDEADARDTIAKSIADGFNSGTFLCPRCGRANVRWCCVPAKNLGQFSCEECNLSGDLYPKPTTRRAPWKD